MSAPPLIPAFYQMKDYVSEVNRSVPRKINTEYLHFSERSRAPFNEVMHYFDEATFERAGVLHGEFATIRGMILIRRDGLCIQINTSREDAGAADAADRLCDSENFRLLKEDILKNWDQLPVAQSPLIISGPHSHNYFHWTFEAVTKSRFFDTKVREILVPENNMGQLFQRNLMLLTMGSKTLIIQKDMAVRIRDPFLSHELMSENSIHWLRKTINITAEHGNRKIYLRRSTHGAQGRPGQGVSETPEFLAFLKEYAFETVDMADKELKIEEQVRALDKASIILAPHSASLTNLAYLNPPLTVIEIMGAAWPRAYFMHIASMLKFHYYGIFSASYDTDHNIVVDVQELRDAMNNCLTIK